MDIVTERRAMINSINDINNPLKQVKREPGSAQHNTATPKAAAERVDQVELSSTSQQMAVLREIIHKAADVNKARIDFIKQQINVGNYEIISHNIAEKMLSDM